MKQRECIYYIVIRLVNGNTEVTGDLFICQEQILKQT